MAGITELTTGMTGAQFRTAFNNNFALLPYFYNVEDYGAVHDGVTDDTEAIQDAINAAYAGGGGTVFFPNGTYLLSGPLQNNIPFGAYATNYNSQLYIPAPDPGPTTRVTVKLLGESHNKSASFGAGVIWKSTIAGSGTWPSVICSRRYNDGSGTLMNYHDTIIENITILVNPFTDSTGVSMCGINLLYASHPVICNVTVGFYATHVDGYNATLESLVIPENHAFGIGIGFDANDFAEVKGECVVDGFYYGFLFGEGVYAETIHSYHNYISVMALTATYGCVIDYMVSHWCRIDFAGQLETVYKTPGKNLLLVNLVVIEKWFEPASGSWIATRGPAWLEKEYFVTDPSNLLYGRMNFRVSGGLNAMTQKNGGTNFIPRNVRTGGGWHWNTALRPTDPDWGMMGLNINTAKMEMWNGYSWRNIVTEALE